MTTTSTEAPGTRRHPLPAGLDHDVASRLAATEYQRVVDLLGKLEPEHWSAPTPCTGWDVRAMAGHMLGMAQMAASLVEMVRQQRAAKRREQRDGIPNIDGLTAHQVDRNADLTTAELVREFERIAPKAAAGRRRTPGLVRRRLLSEPQQVGEHQEWWTMGYLLDEILTRDPFLHRIDIADATGVSLPATAEHEGVIVDAVVRDWAGRRGTPYDLELTGPAGGHWQRGAAERVTMEVEEFCRQLTGRSPATDLTRTQVPF